MPITRASAATRAPVVGPKPCCLPWHDMCICNQPLPLYERRTQTREAESGRRLQALPGRAPPPPRAHPSILPAEVPPWKFLRPTAPLPLPAPSQLLGERLKEVGPAPRGHLPGVLPSVLRPGAPACEATALLWGWSRRGSRGWGHCSTKARGQGRGQAPRTGWRLWPVGQCICASLLPCSR